MKKSKKLLAMLLVLVMAFTMTAPALAADGESAFAGMPEGAEFKQVGAEDLGVEGGVVYAYTPSELHNPTPMMTAIIYVYPDEAYADIDAAWAAMVDNGLLELAEDEMAAVMMINPVGETWGEQDVDVYYGVMDLVDGGGCSGNYFSYTTYCNLIYAMGEGSGATFINEYLTQECNRIAAVATFGGEMPEGVEEYEALPAYISAGDEAAVDYYMAVNATDSEKTASGIVEYYNAAHTTKRVVVDAEGADAFTKAGIAQAWNLVLRRTTRNTLGVPTWMNASTTEVFALMDRPMVDDLELTYNECSDPETLPNQARWYEWVPNEVFETMADPDDDTEYALVMSYHGSGDHPVFETECNGWVQVAGEERFIVVAPENNNMAGVIMGNIDRAPGSAEQNIALIELLKEKYPIDESRIYVTGFSLGGSNTIGTAMKYFDVFAGMAPGGEPNDARLGDFIVDEAMCEEYDIPFFAFYGTSDMFATTGNPRHYNNPHTIKAALDLNDIENDIDLDALDYETYSFYGFETPEAEITYTKHGVECTTTTFVNDEGIPMVKLLATTGLDHNHYTEYAPVVWDYFKNFSRDPATKEIVYYNAEEELGEFFETLDAEGTADFYGWNVDVLGEGLYHIDESAVFGASSIYIVIDGDEALLVDGGNPSSMNRTDPEKTADLIEALIGGRELTVLVAHGHYDHTGLFADGALDPDAVSVMYIPERDYVDDDAAFIQAVSDLKAYADKVVTINEGDTITMGSYEFKIFDMNGHTEGSIVAVDKEKGLIFSDDSMGSGFVWILFGVEDALARYEEDLINLYDYIKDMDEDTIIYAGHRWQQFLDRFFPKAPGEITIEYVAEMIAVMEATRNGTVVLDDYRSGRTSEKEYALTLDDVNAQICVTESALKEYIETVGGIVGDTLTVTCGEGKEAAVNFTYKGEEAISSVRVSIADNALGTPDVTSEYDYEYNPANGEIVVYTTDKFVDGDVLFTVSYDLDVNPWVANGEYRVNLTIIDATDADGEETTVGRVPARIIIDNDYAQGDVNLDGIVTNADVINLARYLVNLVTLNRTQLIYADVDADGEIDNADLIKLARAIVA